VHGFEPFSSAAILRAKPASVTESTPDRGEYLGEEARVEIHIEPPKGSAVDLNIGDTATPASHRQSSGNAERQLGDFTTTPAILSLVPLAVVIGVLGAGISLGLLDMIGFFTNLFYFQRLSIHLVSPYGNTLGAIAVVIPIGGGLIVGLMARFGSEQIRGHGIPEAMERGTSDFNGV
jgi:hypothetical protein